MQLQGHVRVLGGVFGGAIHVDLIEGDLLRALAGNVLEMNGLDAQILGDGRVHVVAGGDAVEHVGFEHGIVALAGERDAVVRQDVRVVLEVMAEFGLGEILEHGLQGAEHRVPIQLRGRSGVIVAERDVRSLPGGDREGYAHDPRLHVVETIGFRVE